MQTVEPVVGTPWSQFEETSQNPSPFNVHVVVHTGVAGSEATPSGNSTKTSGSAAINPDRRNPVALLTAKNVAASRTLFKG